MSDPNTPEPSPSATSRRRSSFAGMIDLFGSRSSASNSPPQGTSPYPGPITHAAAQAQQRRLSITTVGLGTSPNGSAPTASPFGPMRPRGPSVSSASTGSGSVDESPFEDGDAQPASNNSASPFARRVSFGARALRDVRTGSGSSPGSGGGGGNNANEGFNFAENMRARAERGSISQGMGGPNMPSTHGRAKSIAVMDPPVREMPAQQRKPDQFQERILKGDFYMD